MKILMIDKYYFIKGGAETYMFELSEILESRGHKVIPFAMKHVNNFETPYERYFAQNIDYNIKSPLQKAVAFFKITGRMIYSRDTRQRLEELLREERPDIAHLHMIDHQLSPSILLALKKFGVPAIQTIHQYKLVCPNYRLYNPGTGKVCEKCLDGNLFHPIFERCHKNSTAASIAIALESSIHRAMRIYEKNIDIFHVPSRFIGEKMRQAGVGEDNIRHLFYTIKMDKFTPHYKSKNYLLYYGRLADEKGILTLLKAMKGLPGALLKIAGDGPQKGKLELFIANNGMENVELVGKKSGDELESLVKNARFIVVPSEWYDNSPLVIYESFAYGKPVIASKMGGMPELIDHDENGLLFDAGDVDDLKRQMKILWESPRLAVKYGKAAREKAEREFDPDVHYQKILQWYDELLNYSAVLATNHLQ